MEKKEASYTVAANVNWCSNLQFSTTENSMEVPQKTKNRVAIWSSNATPGDISRQNSNLKRYMHPYVRSSITHKTRKQPTCSSTDEWIKKLRDTYTMSYCMHVCLVAWPQPTLCDPMDCSPPDSSVHGIFQARILEWVAISSSRVSSWPRDQTRISWVSCITDRFFTTEPWRSPHIYNGILLSYKKRMN